MLGIHILAYIAVVILVFTSIIRAFRIIRAPLNLRWELYPVAHEKERAKYGGSYFEEYEWWKKPREKSTFNEIKTMLGEILLLKGVWEHNRSLWYWSYPFHIGLYALVGLLGTLFIGAVVQAAGLAVNSEGSWIIQILFWLPVFFGVVASIFGIYGSIGLFMKRITDKKLRPYSTPATFFNVFFVGLIFLTVAFAWYSYDRSYTVFRAFVQDLITFNFHPVESWAVALQIVVICAFFIYFPFTNMVHMFMKYFTWHGIRWEDTPNFKGSEIEKKIMQALKYGVGWAAPHIQTGKSWGEVATEIPEDMRNEK